MEHLLGEIPSRNITSIWYTWEVGNRRALLKMLPKRLVKALMDYQLPESHPVGIPVSVVKLQSGSAEPRWCRREEQNCDWLCAAFMVKAALRRLLSTFWFCLLNFCCWRQGLQLRLASNSRSSSLYFPSDGIRGMSSQTKLTLNILKCKFKLIFCINNVLFICYLSQ